MNLRPHVILKVCIWIEERAAFQEPHPSFQSYVPICKTESRFSGPRLHYKLWSRFGILSSAWVYSGSVKDHNRGLRLRSWIHPQRSNGDGTKISKTFIISTRW